MSFLLQKEIWLLILKSLRVISLKFLLTMSMLYKTEWSWDLTTWSEKVNQLDISESTNCLHFFYWKCDRCSTAVRLKHTLFTTVTLRTQNANRLEYITTHAIYSTCKLRNSRVYYITFILSLLRACISIVYTTGGVGVGWEETRQKSSAIEEIIEEITLSPKP